jgi:hypothetical protein
VARLRPGYEIDAIAECIGALDSGGDLLAVTSSHLQLRRRRVRGG